jgi:hypothetical protein
MKASRTHRWTMLVVSTGLCLVCAEALGRFYVDRVTREPVVPPQIGRFDPEFGWRPRANAHGNSRRTGREIEYRINSKGIRDEEVPHAKPDGEFRIVAIGDSRTFGFGVSMEEHFTTHLERALEDVQVVNLGVMGFGVDQALLYLRSEGFRYEPDLVIAYVAHYGDHRHLHTRRFGKGKPRFVLDQGKLLLTNSPVSPPSADRQGLRSVDSWLMKHLVSYRLFNQAVASVRQGDTRARGGESAPAEDGAPAGPGTGVDDAVNRELHALAEAIVFAMHDESLAHGARFLLVTEVEELHEAAVSRQVPVLDVRAALSDPSFALPDGLGHLNGRGNEVLAAEIAAYLTAHDLEPAPARRAGAGR